MDHGDPLKKDECPAYDQGCQTFLGTTYQNGEKRNQITINYTKGPQNKPNGRKIDQMTIQYINILPYKI
jgi:hypothetical protein